ncbi:hypothetical protein BOTBODRAFT_171781 [Botryobasidium botryosum FD-172 SS1]|uniref:Protein OS-9 homolog n=1 Tax=Botryobasidium botryosum (strain FD-172 SS1) TaxID=930990 RepID=A0A067MR82_BOTB1|nr:hypothetical protein BOTBODRAFT_171781 [Botryobasidium botryosum FD-172 SS1]
MSKAALGLVSLLLARHSLAQTSVPFSSIPEDPFSFPKFRVAFLNGQPVTNKTAEQWLRDGLPGGEDQFMEREWQESPRSLETIDGSEDAQDPTATSSAESNLQLMRLGPKRNYLCFVPAAPEPPSTGWDDISAASISPSKTWALLEPLSDICLFHRQGWFTYSYCHGRYVRQFKELPHAHPHPPGGVIPQEDEEWEAYTLGVAPSPRNALGEMIHADEAAENNKLELARGAGQRYLVQRWGGGTYCDKTGYKRDIEIQFHCSMTTTDTISLVQETSTCSYVMVIQTPRLCGEPGFKSERETHEESVIRCREVVENPPYRKHLAEVSYPSGMPAVKPLQLPPRAQRQSQTTHQTPGTHQAPKTSIPHQTQAQAQSKSKPERHEHDPEVESYTRTEETDDRVRLLNIALETLLRSKLAKETGGRGGNKAEVDDDEDGDLDYYVLELDNDDLEEQLRGKIKEALQKKGGKGKSSAGKGQQQQQRRRAEL